MHSVSQIFKNSSRDFVILFYLSHRPCKLYSSSDRATPLLRTPVKQHWNIMRTRIIESVSPVPFVGLTDSVHKIDGIPVNEESFSTDVTLAAVAQSPVVSISTKKHKSSHQRTSTPQLSSERKRTTTGSSTFTYIYH